MIGKRQLPEQNFDDDGAERLAILGTLLVLAVVGAGVVLNMSI